MLWFSALTIQPQYMGTKNFTISEGETINQFKNSETIFKTFRVVNPSHGLPLKGFTHPTPSKGMRTGGATKRCWSKDVEETGINRK